MRHGPIISKTTIAKKSARGYWNPNNCTHLICFISGQLKFDYPLYSRKSQNFWIKVFRYLFY